MMLNNAALVLGARMDVDGNLNFLAETVEDRHQAVDGEAAEAGTADAGKICGGIAGDLLRLAHAQVFFLDHIDNSGA